MEDKNFQMLKQGAEARLYKGIYLGRPTIVKERFKKTYRHPDLDDRLTKERIRGEVKGLMRAKNVGKIATVDFVKLDSKRIRTPTVYMIRPKTNSIYMEFLEGADTVNDFIGLVLKNPGSNAGWRGQLEELAVEVGKSLGKLHEAGIIHGDLTTSNILVERVLPEGESSENNNFGTKSETAGGSRTFNIVLIDFGLSHMDQSAEDKGVDLYVLERALTSTYSSIEWFFECVLKAYMSEYSKGGEEVFVKLEEIRLRGRKRTMVG